MDDAQSEAARPGEPELEVLARRVLEVLDAADWPMTLFELGPPTFGDDDAAEPVSEDESLELVRALELLETRGLVVSWDAPLRDIGVERVWRRLGKRLRG